MKLKSLLFSGLSLVLVAALAIGGTLAYLTDRDSEVNTFTVGDVAIDLTEGFEQGSELIPGVKINKDAEITNIGKNDAWVWLTVLLPKELGPYTAPDNLSASNNVVHWNYPAANAANIKVQFESVPVSLDPDGDGVENDYYRTSLLYNKVLAPEAKTGIMLSTVYMDTHIDIDPNGDWYWVKDGGEAIKLDWNSNTNGNPKIYVSAYAIQADQFADVDAAYAAYNTQWGENGAEYGDFVKTFDQLKKAVAEGGNIVLGSNIEVTEMIEIPENLIVSIDGQGYTLTRADSYTGTILSLCEYAELALSNITLDGENVESTGNLIYIDSFGKLILNDGTILENHVGGTTYENDPYRGPENSVIHCDGETKIVMNKGSLIQNNVAKGNFATVIMSAYGVTCELNGGKIINNTSEKNNYTVWFGNFANVTVSDGFEAYGNTDGGLMRVNQGTTFTMNGGKLDGNSKSAIYTWASNYVTLNGGEIVGNVNLNYTPATVGGTDVDGVIYKDNEVTKWAMNLTPDFGTVRYSIAGNITQLNIVPDEGYTYTAGDENKLVCENAGYETYWDAESGCFKVQASN